MPTTNPDVSDIILDVSISGFLSMRDLTFFSSVAKPETIQRFLQDKLNPVVTPQDATPS